jgi:putative tricarboxylic transport membrane protein
MNQHPHHVHGHRLVRALAVVLGCCVPAACAGGGFSGQSGGAGSAQAFPTDDLTVIAAGDPGGGLDTQARMLVQAMEATGTDAGFEVVNMGGGGGNAARAATLQDTTGHTVVVESNRIFLNPMTGTTDMQLSDFQPLANLSNDYLVWAVRADSKYQSAQQVLDDVKANPRSVSFGVGTVPSDDQLTILKAASESGITDLRSLNVVSFESGGDLLTQLLGGHVDVISTGLSELAEQVEAGKVRLLAISAPSPQGGAAQGVPTWSEMGADVTIDHWRGVFGPSEMPDEAVNWWIDTIRQATQTPEWDQQIDKVQLTSAFEPGGQFLQQTVQPETREYAPLLREVGMTER